MLTGTTWPLSYLPWIGWFRYNTSLPWWIPEYERGESFKVQLCHPKAQEILFSVDPRGSKIYLYKNIYMCIYTYIYINTHTNTHIYIFTHITNTYILFSSVSNLNLRNTRPHLSILSIAWGCVKGENNTNETIKVDFMTKNKTWYT